VKAVFDTNIFISAIEFGGTPRKIFLSAVAGEFKLYTSPVLLEELDRVLRDRFQYPASRSGDIRRRLEELCVVVSPRSRFHDCTDEDDNRVLECAHEAHADCIVTGDRALLRLHPFDQIEILTPAEFRLRIRQSI
jgi:putative PIN family toxin of toxin-antitoxin system